MRLLRVWLTVFICFGPLVGWGYALPGVMFSLFNTSFGVQLANRDGKCASVTRR